MSAPRSAALAPLAAAALLAVSAAPALTIVELQGARSSQTLALRDAEGREGRIELIQLAPTANAWLLLRLQPPGAAVSVDYHLENTDPARRRVALDPAAPGRLTVGGATCTLWPGAALAQAASRPLAYALLCEGRLALRNRMQGHRSPLEATTEFLRDHVWGGERIIGFVKREFYQDAFIEQGRPTAPIATAMSPPGAPPPARLAGGAVAQALDADGLGLELAAGGRKLTPGRWAAAAGLDGVYVSVARPADLVADPARSGPRLDAVESQALDFFVAFDLAALELGFELGTEHPRLGWSDRVQGATRDARLPGPDGIANALPLVRTGMVMPLLQARVVATFTAGFKREHGAFAHGALAQIHGGSHYGFVEQGVVFSRLQPGLATLLVDNSGAVEMKTWQHDDEPRLAVLRHARQNGVPLVETGPTGSPVVGALVDHWSAGNWSGSAEERERTLRAGACLVDDGDRRFLVYGYFSTATPRAMAQVFLAYGCRYAMHLDMNALEHTYLALYPGAGAQRAVEHLVPGMAVLDKSKGSTLLPRFMGFADDRDFFYLLSRKERR